MPPSPCPSALTNQDSRKSLTHGATVRPRPRPSSSGRSVSPSALSLRRSGYIESTDGDKLTLTSTTSAPSSPRDATLIGTASPTSNIVGVSQAKRNHATLWEDFEGISNMASSTAANAHTLPPTSLSSDPFSDFLASTSSINKITYTANTGVPSSSGPFDSTASTVTAGLTVSTADSFEPKVEEMAVGSVQQTV